MPRACFCRAWGRVPVPPFWITREHTFVQSVGVLLWAMLICCSQCFYYFLSLDVGDREIPDESYRFLRKCTRTFRFVRDCTVVTARGLWRSFWHIGTAHRARRETLCACSRASQVYYIVYRVLHIVLGRIYLCITIRPTKYIHSHRVSSVPRQLSALGICLLHQ